MDLHADKKPFFEDFRIEDAELWRLHDPVVDQDLKYFEARTGGTRMPRRDDISPEEMKAILPEVALLEPIYDETGLVVDAKGLLEGTKLDNFYGSLTGTLISDYPVPIVSDRILVACRRCIEIAKPIVVVADALSEQKNYLTITVLYVPMSNDGVRVDRIFLHNQVKSKFPK